MTSPYAFPSDYHQKSLEALETALTLGAYQAWRASDPGPSYPVDVRYAALPALTKKDIREHFPAGFVPLDKDVQKGLEGGEISFVQTSGSADAVRVTNIWNQKWWDVSERASWKLNSHASRLANGNHPEAILANARNVGLISDDADLPFEKRRLSRFLYLNEKTDPSRWTDGIMDRMLRELDIFKPVILEANPSLLAKLCRYAAGKHKSVFQPGLITFTYEYPSSLHLRQIRLVFRSPLASSYGTTETGYIFMQCEAGKFHQNSEVCRVDIQPLKKEHGGPLVGRILVTTFGNPWYCMLRFDVGDLARLDEKQSCPCGRKSGIIASAIEGRFINATLDTRGCLVTLRRVDEMMGTVRDLDEYRLDQSAPGVYNVHLSTPRKDKEKVNQEVSRKLCKIYGKDTEISIVYEDFLCPEDTGKYCLARPLFPLKIEDYLDASHFIK
jgi:phenylacetate-coenzyme A ligase PaaK-like adenylate-forming protein